MKQPTSILKGAPGSRSASNSPEKQRQGQAQTDASSSKTNTNSNNTNKLMHGHLDLNKYEQHSEKRLREQEGQIEEQ